jgi:hypothetical protein
VTRVPGDEEAGITIGATDFATGVGVEAIRVDLGRVEDILGLNLSYLRHGTSGPGYNRGIGLRSRKERRRTNSRGRLAFSDNNPIIIVGFTKPPIGDKIPLGNDGVAPGAGRAA